MTTIAKTDWADDDIQDAEWRPIDDEETVATTSIPEGMEVYEADDEIDYVDVSIVEAEPPIEIEPIATFINEIAGFHREGMQPLYDISRGSYPRSEGSIVSRLRAVLRKG